MKYFLTTVIILFSILVNSFLLAGTLFWGTIACLYIDLGLLLSTYIVCVIYWMKNTSSVVKIKTRCLFIAYVGLGICLHGIYMGITGNHFYKGTLSQTHAVRVLLNTLGAEYGAWAPASLLLFTGAAMIFISARKLLIHNKHFKADAQKAARPLN
ncbi:hypothetical protein CPC19_08235 [Cycloclasticus sp. PY97N]|jgi:hypothetical protein|uniref:Uncharacterized protein n=1 Tax=Cycloclasticus pugetii TaxID=34068 RepID=A0AB33Z3T6_9GAMM|nr:hypothetical protein CPC19_08235 [Cycloclasticus sp. PY97N]EPD13933.1 hypothetical protein L196_00500 [Cycloclasticus pugetii]